MEDFDYSVEICDRDWECFFEECEECNLLSPAIAGIESGMSDFDDTTSIFANIVQKSHPMTHFPEADRTNDGLRECDGSPVDNYLKKQGPGGMESILSGSEEDIHLQCVNVFLERLRSDAEAEEFTEPRTQGRPWNEKRRDATQEEGCCAGVKPQANLRFSSVSTESERNVGQPIEPLINGHNGKKTLARVEHRSNVASTVLDLNPVLQDNHSARCEVGLFTTKDLCTETKLNETTRSTQNCRSWNHTNEPQTAVALKKVKKAPDGVKSESSSLERYVGTSCNKQDAVTYERTNDDMSVAKPAALKLNKLASHDLSPSATVKRRRRRKRRLGEVADSMYGCEKQDWVKSSDSEEEQGAFFTHELQKCAQYSQTENCPAVNYTGKVSVKDNSTNDPSYQILQRGMCKMTRENDIINGRTDISDNSDNLRTPSEHSCRLQFEQSSRLDQRPALQMMKSLCVCSDRKPPCNAEVKSGCFSILPAAELNDLTVEIDQNEDVSATKTPVDEGKVTSDILSNAMHQQRLETTRSFKDQDGDSTENHPLSVSVASANGSDAGNANPEQSPVCSMSENYRLVQPSKCPNNSIYGQPEEHPEMLSSWPKSKVMSQSDTTAELRCPSDPTAVSSCCTADTRSLASLSNGSITEMSDCSCAPISQTGSMALRDETLLEKHEEVDGRQSWSVSNDAADQRCDITLKADDSAALIEAGSPPELVPDSKNSVFLMSSFWRDMEKLTINDILGLRMISGAASDRRLPPLQENEPMDGLDLSDSGFFTQPDEPKPEGTHDDTCTFQSSMENLSQNVHVRADDIVLTPAVDSSRPVAPAAVQTGLRKMLKNVSVHNLPALEAGNYPWKKETLQTQIEEEFENLDDFMDAGISEESEGGDCPDSSAQHSFSMSLSGIFDFIFGGRQTHSSQSAIDDSSPSHAYGSSVPETYDHFFSEFDTESFFYPFIRANDQANDELVPVFSCSTSARRNIQYPEVYECFFASSSSDESSSESDEEDNQSPVRVVTRLSRTSSSSKFPTDIYDCFFTDKDLKQNLFWKNMFSFRNMSLNASRLKQQSISDSLVTVKPGVRPFQRTFLPLSSLANQDAAFFDPALYLCGDRFFRQLSQQQLENFQMNPNPRLDAPLLPLRQSDMCLICIAFASWVLKTANPQVGDAWKAVLLANVSALSAIRYLRKYVKADETASDEKHLT